MKAFTRERLLKIQQWRETYGPGSNVVLPAEEAEELARIALASLEAEPVAWTSEEALAEVCCDETGMIGPQYMVGNIPLYRHAQHAPVVPDEVNLAIENLKKKLVDCNRYNYCSDDVKRVEDSFRAAMLQGAEPVSNRDELPLDYLHGHKDGLEWAAQLAEANHPQTGDWIYDDPVELAKAIRKGPDMPELKSVPADEDDNFYSWFGRFWLENYQQNNYTTSAKQMLGTMAEFAFRAGRESATQDGNSPVIPDTWIPVSERMPERDVDVLVYCADKKEQMVGYMERNEAEGWFRFASLPNGGGVYCKPTHWMPLPAAPQQEVKGE